MATKTSDRATARERLLSAADELFYDEGVHTVGIDRVIAHAGVAKATLYSSFGSKDELIRSYLKRRHQRWVERMSRRLDAEYDSPRERLLGVFDALGDSLAEPGFRGCAFVNASAEASPGSAVEEAAEEFRVWRRDLFTELAEAAGAHDPAELARQFVILYDGALVTARMDRSRTSAADARAMAAGLVDAATR